MSQSKHDMRKNEFKLSSGLKLSVFMILIIALNACQTVYTANPLPSADSQELKSFPSSLAGDFLVVDEDQNAFNEVGRQFVRITVKNEQHCLVETYTAFELDELTSDPHSDRFRLEGGYLIYRNDSLIQELAQAKTRVKEEPDSELHKGAVKTLEVLAENGHMTQAFPVTKRGQLYTYNRYAILEIDLANNSVVGYDGESLVEDVPAVIKERNGRLFINVEQADKEWETGIFEINEDRIIAHNISFDHVLENKTQYEKIANLDRPRKNTIVLAPSLEGLDKMLEEEGFLDNQMTLKRIELKEGEVNERPSWWLIALGAMVLVVILRVMRKPQT